MQFDWSAIWPAIPILLEGAKMTLWISVLGLAGGLIIGLVAGFARCFGGWIANHIWLHSMLFAIQMCLGDVVFSGQGAAVAKPELLTHA